MNVQRPSMRRCRCMQMVHRLGVSKNNSHGRSEICKRDAARSDWHDEHWRRKHHNTPPTNRRMAMTTSKPIPIKTRTIDCRSSATPIGMASNLATITRNNSIALSPRAKAPESPRWHSLQINCSEPHARFTIWSGLAANHPATTSAVHPGKFATNCQHFPWKTGLGLHSRSSPAT